MIGKFKLISITALILLCTACSAPLTKTQLESANTAGVVNNFPKEPTFNVIGTTVFNNEYASITDSSFHNKVTEIVTKRLESRGFNVTTFEQDDEDNKSKVDLLIKIIPREVYQIPGTYGFGVNQRSFLGKKASPVVYVALNISPYLHGESKGNAFYLQNLEQLTFDDLAESWDSLPTDKKEEIITTLNTKIESTINELLNNVGI
jgi:hypothetical protein